MSKHVGFDKLRCKTSRVEKLRIWHISGLVIARINDDLGNQITGTLSAPYTGERD